MRREHIVAGKLNSPIPLSHCCEQLYLTVRLWRAAGLLEMQGIPQKKAGAQLPAVWSFYLIADGCSYWATTHPHVFSIENGEYSIAKDRNRPQSPHELCKSSGLVWNFLSLPGVLFHLYPRVETIFKWPGEDYFTTIFFCLSLFNQVVQPSF